MLDEIVADRAARSSQEVHDSSRHPRFLQHIHEQRRDEGASEEGFRTTVLPVTAAATVIPAIMAQGKFTAE